MNNLPTLLLVGIVVLLTFQVDHVTGFAPLKQAKKQHQTATALSASTNTTTLTGLVSGMLEAQREMAKEMADMEKYKSDTGMPSLGNDGIYRIQNEEQYSNFLKAHSDKVVIVKFSSPFCKACKMLKQRFPSLHQYPQFQEGGAVLADIVVSNNPHMYDAFTDYIQSQLEVVKIPTIHFYVGGELAETIACEPEGCSWNKIKHQIVDSVDKVAPTVAAAAAATEEEEDEESPIPTLPNNPQKSEVSQKEKPRQFMDSLFGGIFARTKSKVGHNE